MDIKQKRKIVAVVYLSMHCVWAEIGYAQSHEQNTGGETMRQEGDKAGEDGKLEEKADCYAKAYRLSKHSDDAFVAAVNYFYAAVPPEDPKRTIIEKKKLSYEYFIYYLRGDTANEDNEKMAEMIIKRFQEQGIYAMDITTKPAGAKVYLVNKKKDEKKENTTYLFSNVFIVGDEDFPFQIRATLEGHNPQKTPIIRSQKELVAYCESRQQKHDGQAEVSMAGRYIFPVELLFTGTFSVEDLPPDSLISVRSVVNDKLQDRPKTLSSSKPARGMSLPAGDAELTVERKGYLQKTMHVTIPVGGTVAIPFPELEKDPNQWAALFVDGEPKGATVLLGEETLPGKTDQTYLHLEPGGKKLTIRYEDRSCVTDKLFLEKGKIQQIFYKLPEPYKPKSIIWWGAGSTLLTGMGGGVLAWMSHSKRKSFYASDNPSRELYDEVDRLNTASTVLLVCAGALLTATVTYFFVDRQRKEYPHCEPE